MQLRELNDVSEPQAESETIYRVRAWAGSTLSEIRITEAADVTEVLDWIKGDLSDHEVELFVEVLKTFEGPTGVDRLPTLVRLMGDAPASSSTRSILFSPMD